MTVTAPAARRAWRIRREASFRTYLSPPPRLKQSEWAERHFYLPKDQAEPGRLRLSRTPYLREILDVMSDPDVEEVVFMKASRVGATVGVIGTSIGYRIDLDPGPMIVVQPTVDDGETWSKDILMPMIEACPRLRGKVADATSRTSTNTILKKLFPGGRLSIIGANAPRMFRQRDARDVFFDEVDAYPASAGVEGDPIALAKKRAMLRSPRKYFLASKPTIKGASRIEKAFKTSSRGYYFVACPHCGHFQRLVWSGIVWDKTPGGQHLPETAGYQCEACAVVIEERYKSEMMLAGHWEHEEPENRIRGYHISTLYSLFEGAKWSYIVREFLAAKGDPELMKPWTNDVLGEPFEVKALRIASHALLDRLERYPRTGEGAESVEMLPMGVGVLTRSVDVQDDRLETDVWGWGAGEESWLISTEVVLGDPGLAGTWAELAERMQQRFRHASGAFLRPLMTFIDSGGHYTDEVYSFCRAHAAEKVFACKGSSEQKAPPVSLPVLLKHARLFHFVLGPNALKQSFYSRLTIPEPGPGFVHLPDWCSVELLDQLTAEELRTPKLHGETQFIWVLPNGRRNERLDLRCMAQAALRSVSPGIEKRLDRIVEALVKRGEALASAPEGESTPEEPKPGAMQVAPALQRVPPRRNWATGWK